MKRAKANHILIRRTQLYYLSLVILSLGAMTGVWVAEGANPRTRLVSGVQATANKWKPPIHAAPSKEQVTGLPIRLIIPKLKVAAEIEHIGLNERGHMSRPTNGAKTAWYKLGYKPGQKGSAVVAGEMYTPNDVGVFWKIEELTRGDVVTVAYDSGRQYDFVVDATRSYAAGQLPLRQVFAADGRACLNLIAIDDDQSRQIVATTYAAEPSE